MPILSTYIWTCPKRTVLRRPFPVAQDVAVSTACGMLNAIVVESTEDAQAVIEFIRRQARWATW